MSQICKTKEKIWCKNGKCHIVIYTPCFWCANEAFTIFAPYLHLRTMNKVYTNISWNQKTQTSSTTSATIITIIRQLLSSSSSLLLLLLLSHYCKSSLCHNGCQFWGNFKCSRTDMKQKRFIIFRKSNIAKCGLAKIRKNKRFNKSHNNDTNIRSQSQTFMHKEQILL